MVAETRVHCCGCMMMTKKKKRLEKTKKILVFHKLGQSEARMRRRPHPRSRLLLVQCLGLVQDLRHHRRRKAIELRFSCRPGVSCMLLADHPMQANGRHCCWPLKGLAIDGLPLLLLLLYYMSWLLSSLCLASCQKYQCLSFMPCSLVLRDVLFKVNKIQFLMRKCTAH